MSSRCISSIITAGVSFTPRSSTVWQPSGMPASASMPSAGHRGRGELVGMIEVGVDEERVEPLQQGAELRRDPLGQMAGYPAADPDDLDVRNRPQPCQNDLEPPVVEQQRVAAGHDHVPDLGVLLQIAEGALELRHRDLLGVAHLAPAGAEPAIGGADRRDQEERPVGIAMGDVGNRAIGVLVERVHDAVHHVQLLDGRARTAATSDRRAT